MFRARYCSAIAVCATTLACPVGVLHLAAQGVIASPDQQEQAQHTYSDILSHVQQGDMTVDFRAFRVAGTLKAGPHASKLETDERTAFRSVATSGDWMTALDLANRDYASPIAQYDAMTAYQALGKTDEAAAHEKILNALLESIRQSLRANIDETLTAAIITEQGGKEKHRERSQEFNAFCSQFGERRGAGQGATAHLYR
jgi:hypothetical protein